MSPLYSATPLAMDNTSPLPYISVKFFKNSFAIEILRIRGDNLEDGLKNPCHIQMELF